MIPNCTLVTSCFVLTKYNPNCRNLETTIKNMETLLQIPVFLMIYCDSVVVDDIRKIRNKYGYNHLTQYKVMNYEEIWAYQYVDTVKSNREKYHPTRDHRTCAESHLLCCNKFDFVLQTMESNPFHTDRFGWIDSNIGPNASKIAENYEQQPGILVDVLNNISDNFKIQVLNVVDKKYKNPEHWREYYNQYRWVVCGSLFTMSPTVGKPILERLNRVFIEHTAAGYGHGEEMFFLPILDEFYDDIDRSYGDYKHILNNFIQPKMDLLYTYMNIVRQYANMGQYRECYDCCKHMIRYMKTVTENVDYATYIMILLTYYKVALYHSPDEIPKIANHVAYLVSDNDSFHQEFHRYKYIASIQNIESATLR